MKRGIVNVIGNATRQLSTAVAKPDVTRIECAVIGAGVVGLACARALALAGREVIILDSASTFGTESSSRNSEVIHAGLYYRKDSLKARLCVEGKDMLYDYCASQAIPHKRITKLVVASEPGQLPALRSLMAHAASCGVSDLQMLTAEEVRSLEPDLHCHAAVYSPSTGILDSHSYMASLLAHAESAGAIWAPHSLLLKGRVCHSSSLSFSSTPSNGESGASALAAAQPPLELSKKQQQQQGQEQQQQQQEGHGQQQQGQRQRQAQERGMEGGQASEQEQQQGGGTTAMNGEDQTAGNQRKACAPHLGIELEIEDMMGGERLLIRADLVINAAGLGAQRVSRAISGLDPAFIPKQYLARGVYFCLKGGVKAPFSRLIYPLPPREGGGLGTHLTLDMGGGTRFGPDVEWIQKVDYTVDPDRADSFYPAIRTFWPSLPDGALEPGYAGVRAKLAGPGKPAADFMIQTERVHGIRGLVCLYGIESPGLTASLAIAEHVKRLLLGTKAEDK